jgi:HD-GYP domain-containing protein (c-di-GMP phosphodiesterase class II)
MTSERPYRPGKATEEQALEELHVCSGTQFDPKIVKVFSDLYLGLTSIDADLPKNLKRN